MKSTKNNVISTLLAFSLAFALGQNADAAALKINNVVSPTENSSHFAAADCELSKKVSAELIDKIIAGDFEGVRKNFNENMLKNSSAAQLKKYWNEVIIANAGKYKSREKALYQEYPTYFAVLTRLQMEKSRIVVAVNFGEDGKIAGLFFNPA